MSRRTRATSFVVGLALFTASAAATRIIVTIPANTPADATIYLAGSTPTLGTWSADGLKLTRQGDGTYVGDAAGPAEFKVTRGSWATVEKTADGGEMPNRRLDAGAAEVRIAVARWAEATAPTSRPSTVVGDLRIEQVAGRTIRVWLPPSYATNPYARFPVLYLHDGQNCFDAATAAFGVEWQVDETLTRLIAADEIPPIIVVGVDNAGDRRIAEYTFTKDKGRGGDGVAYATLLLEKVKPHVDATYRTRPEAQHTFVGGSSLGGLLSLELLCRYGQRFAGGIVMSPSLWWDGESATARVATTPPIAGTLVWLDMGGHEGDEPAAEVARARRLDASLRRAGVNCRLIVDDAGEHNEAAWARRFPDAIRFLLDPLAPPATRP